MTDFEWPSTVLIGDGQLDEQHKRLLLLAEAAVESLMNSDELESGAAKLDALIEYAGEHFAFEDNLMRAVDFPDAERHAKSHASLLNELRAYRYKVQQGRDSVPVGMTSFLWFTQHIDVADRDLAAWLKSRNAGPGSS